MLSIRLADPATDAAAIAAIYAPNVTDSFVSFEEEPPSAAEMAARIEATLAGTPWLVAVEQDEVVGYAYAGRHRERAGYRWSVDISAYVRADRHGRGIGSALYRALIRILAAQGFVNAYAGITQPNPASVALHRSVGMELVGVYGGVGYKLGAWRDVAWYQLRLTNDPGNPPKEPIQVADLLAFRPSLLAES